MELYAGIIIDEKCKGAWVSCMGRDLIAVRGQTLKSANKKGLLDYRVFNVLDGQFKDALIDWFDEFHFDYSVTKKVFNYIENLLRSGPPERS